MTESETMKIALKNGSVCVGTKNGKTVYVNAETLARFGLRECLEMMGILKRWPVKTDLNGNTVMVEGATHDDAISRYLNRIEK